MVIWNRALVRMLVSNSPLWTSHPSTLKPACRYFRRSRSRAAGGSGSSRRDRRSRHHRRAFRHPEEAVGGLSMPTQASSSRPPPDVLPPAIAERVDDLVALGQLAGSTFRLQRLDQRLVQRAVERLVLSSSVRLSRNSRNGTWKIGRVTGVSGERQRGRLELAVQRGDPDLSEVQRQGERPSQILRS